MSVSIGAQGPLRSVLAAFDSGVHSLEEICTHTGLSRQVVDAAIDHLVRAGQIEARELAVGCPTAGCGSCASGTASGGAGCGAPGPSAQRSGPVLVALSRRRTGAAERC